MADIEDEGMESRRASITVERPQDGETLTVAITPGLRVVLAFNPAAAKFAVAGDDFVLKLEDGGQIVFQGLVAAAQGEDAPTIQIAGIDIDAGVLMEQALVLAEQAQADPIETAAGEEGEGAEATEVADGGSSRYDDSFGDLIGGLIKQGVIGETELGLGPIADSNIEVPVDTVFLSEGYLLNDGGFFSEIFDPPSATPPTSPAPDVTSDPEPAPSATPPTSLAPDVASDPEPAPSASPASGSDSGEGGDSGEIDDSSELAPLSVNGMDIITNEANGILQIPDELILYLADPDTELSVSGTIYDGVADNAHVWSVPGVALTDADSFNTRVDDGDGHVRFHISGTGPLYQGSFTYEAADGEGATGGGTIGVQSVETGKDHGYWTLDGSDAGEVLLGLDGRNQIDGGGGDDVIHGGHDSSGDILIGGDGDDVIFGGSGKDDLQGGNGDDTFIMRAGFGRDEVDGGDGSDTITLDGVLTGADVAEGAIEEWLTLNDDATFTHNTETNTITFDATASGTIDLGGGNEITFLNVEEIDYAIFA